MNLRERGEVRFVPITRRDAIKSARGGGREGGRGRRERERFPPSTASRIIDVYPRGISRRLTVAWLISGGGLARPKMTLNLDAGNGTGNGGNSGQLPPKKPGGLSLGLPLEINTARGSADLVDVGLPLERQGCVLVSRIIFALCLLFANPSGEKDFVEHE